MNSTFWHRPDDVRFSDFYVNSIYLPWLAVDTYRVCAGFSNSSEFEGTDLTGMHQPSSERLAGRRYMLPTVVSAALERIFEESVDGVKVVEYSRYARAHLGMSATTRPNRILLATSGAEFIANPEMVLHEYFHVLRQWRTGYLTRWRYVYESMRCGYWENRFEREAREFSATTRWRYLEYLGQQENESATDELARRRNHLEGARNARR